MKFLSICRLEGRNPGLCSRSSSNDYCGVPQSRRPIPGGFTLIELLVVIAIIAILAAILLPVLAAAQKRATQALCLSNQKQLAMAWIMYVSDNSDKVPSFSNLSAADNPPDWYIQANLVTQSPSAGLGLMAPANLAGNDLVKWYCQTGFTKGALYQYASHPDIIHCPGDFRTSIAGHYTWCSYSGVGGFVGGDANLEGATAGSISKQSQIRHPSDRFLWVEESASQQATVSGQTFGINQGTWEMLPGNPSSGFVSAKWVDSPAAFHGANSTFCFVDGHAQSRKWLSGLVVAFANDMNPNKYENMGGSDKSGTAADAATADLDYVASHFPTSLNP